MDETFATPQQQESIKRTKNAKGEYQWEGKIFLKSLDDDKEDLERIDTINKELEGRYGKHE